jgi:LAS superfamily LD-carboxypeptidase LdcB
MDYSILVNKDNPLPRAYIPNTLENAHRYGFILRYPEGKEDITKYSYEPWHLRYVGNIASNIYNNNLTLEEYKDKESIK